MSKSVNRFFPAMVAFYFFGSLGISRVLLATGWSIPMWASYIVSESILLIPAVIYVIFKKINLLKSLPYKFLAPMDVILALIAGILIIPMALFLSNVSSLFTSNYVQGEAASMTEMPIVVLFICTAVIPPLVEEFLFRGLFYHSYRKCSVLGGALLSGLLFGLIHLNINQFSYAFFLGIFFAIAVETTGSMWTSIIMHMAVNGYNVIMVQVLKKMTESGNSIVASGKTLADYPTAVVIGELVFLGVIAIGCILLSFLILRSISRRKGRWEYFTGRIRCGFKPQDDEKLVSLPLIVTAIFMVVYMIKIEIM